MTADVVDTRVMREAIEPCQKRPTLPAIPPDRFPRLEKDLFGKVFSFLTAAHAEVQIAVYAVDEQLEQLAKRICVSREGYPVDQCCHSRIVRTLVG